MIKNIRFILTFFILGFIACSEENEIGKVELFADYTLPQGKSDADDQIVDIHKKYGTYILYEYEDLHLKYDFSNYSHTLLDPEEVKGLVELIDTMWFKVYPSEKFKRQFSPYQIFLAKRFWYVNSQNVTRFPALGINNISWAFSDSICMMPLAKKKSLKHDLHVTWWYNKIFENGFMEVPDEFFEGTDYGANSYVEDPDWTSDPALCRERGFVFDWYYEDEWGWDYGWLYLEEENKRYDLFTYITCMILQTEDEWEADWEFPLVKKKYDVLHNYFKEKYDIDLKEVGNQFSNW